MLQRWLQWAPNAPSEITSLFKISKSKNAYSVHCVGQSIGSVTQVQNELTKNIFSLIAPATKSFKAKTFIDAAHQFAGQQDMPSIFMKGKSDYIKHSLSDKGTDQILDGLPSGIALLFDSYGGAIAKVDHNATAFAHRQGTLSSLQYYMQWGAAAETASHLKILKNYYDSLRDHMSGSCYFNYCDMDIKNYAEAYWGDHVPKLVEIKKKYDAKNIFKHPQSLPVN